MGENVNNGGQCCFDFPGYEHIVHSLLGGMEGYGQPQVGRVAGGALRRGGAGAFEKEGEGIFILIWLYMCTSMYKEGRIGMFHRSMATMSVQEQHWPLCRFNATNGQYCQP
jgi:hypothetical protein